MILNYQNYIKMQENDATNTEMIFKNTNMILEYKNDIKVQNDTKNTKSILKYKNDTKIQK